MEILRAVVLAMRNCWNGLFGMQDHRGAAIRHFDRPFHVSFAVLFAILATLALTHDAWAGYGAVAQAYFMGCGHSRSVHVFTWNSPSQAVADKEAMALCVGGDRVGCHITHRFGKGRCMYFSASAGITECYHGYVIAYGSTPGEAAAKCDAARHRDNSAPTCSAPQGGCND